TFMKPEMLLKVVAQGS
ncbi:unnamed protein product, partial [Allacma fusca]